MTFQLVNLPGWFFGSDNKPSYQTYQAFMAQATTETLKVQTVTFPTIETVEIQVKLPHNFDFLNYTAIIWKDDLVYKITNIEVTQVNMNDTQIVRFYGAIDVYFSWMIPLFTENSTEQKQVFFKQKHLNDRLYVGFDKVSVDWGYDFERQFYLMNVHPEIANLGTKPTVYSDSLGNSADLVNWNHALKSINVNTYANGAFINPSTPGDLLNTFVYVKWKYHPGTLNIETVSLPYANLGAWSILNQKWISGFAPGTFTKTLLSRAFASDTYDGLFFFPLPLELCLNNVPSTPGGSLPYTLSTLWFAGTTEEGTWKWDNSFIPYPASLVEYMNNSLPTAEPWYPVFRTLWGNNSVIYGLSMLDQYYFAPHTTLSMLSADALTKFAYDSPFLLNYCKFNVRWCGQDGYIDLMSYTPTYIQAVIDAGLYTPLYSFKIAGSGAEWKLTNLNASDILPLKTIFETYPLYIPYFWNNAFRGKPAYVIDAKNEISSYSVSWQNYLENNLNSYNLGKNIAHLNLQKSEANEAFNVMRTTTDSIGIGMAGVEDFFGNSSGMNTIINSAQSIVDGGFDIKQNSLSYNYEKYGKKHDMTRLASQRTATQPTPLIANTEALQFRLEAPVFFERKAILNYIKLNGFILERWEPWHFWNNRVYCNFVKCAFFADSLLPHLPEVLRKKIDGIILSGLRIWNKSAFTNSFSLIPFSRVTDPLSGSNDSLSKNDDEVDYLSPHIQVDLDLSTTPKKDPNN